MARKKRRKKTRKHKSGGGNGHPTGLGDGDQRKIDEYLADEEAAGRAVRIHNAQDPRVLDAAARIDAVYAGLPGYGTYWTPEQVDGGVFTARVAGVPIAGPAMGLADSARMLRDAGARGYDTLMGEDGWWPWVRRGATGLYALLGPADLQRHNAGQEAADRFPAAAPFISAAFGVPEHGQIRALPIAVPAGEVPVAVEARPGIGAQGLGLDDAILPVAPRAGGGRRRRRKTIKRRIKRRTRRKKHRTRRRRRRRHR